MGFYFNHINIILNRGVEKSMFTMMTLTNDYFHQKTLFGVAQNGSVALSRAVAREFFMMWPDDVPEPKILQPQYGRNGKIHLGKKTKEGGQHQISRSLSEAPR